MCCRDALRSVFDEVYVVNVMDSGDAAHLALMKRPDLGVTFTKLHCWTLTQYSKCVFMDADTLVRNKLDNRKQNTVVMKNHLISSIKEFFIHIFMESLDFSGVKRQTLQSCIFFMANRYYYIHLLIYSTYFILDFGPEKS